MMNFESVVQLFLSDTTTLTSMVVSFARLFIHPSPILAVVREPSTLPAWAFIAVYIFGLPITHTLTTAKVLLLYVCILSAELLTAPITIDYLASPSQKNGSTFFATRYLFNPVEAIGLYCKRRAAYRAVESWGSGIGFSVISLAGIGTEPKPSRIVANLCGFAFNVFSTVGTIEFDKHVSIISYFVACENALERMAQAFPGIEIKKL